MAAGATIRALADEATVVLSSVGERIRNRLLDKVSGTVGHLRDLKGGLTGGGDWLAGLRKNASWKDIWTLAQKTIVKDKGVAALLKHITVVSEVISRSFVSEGGSLGALYVDHERPSAISCLPCLLLLIVV